MIAIKVKLTVKEYNSLICMNIEKQIDDAKKRLIKAFWNGDHKSQYQFFEYIKFRKERLNELNIVRMDLL